MSTRRALLLGDFQVGIADAPFARDAVAAATRALSRARDRGMLVLFTRVEFAPGYLDVAPWSRPFNGYAAHDALPPAKSRLIDGFGPAGDREAEVVKDRFSPFSGGRLEPILRAQRIEHLTVAGVATSGVVLAAFTHAEAHDLAMTVLTDACADPDPDLHAVLTQHLFPRSAEVTTVDGWTA